MLQMWGPHLARECREPDNRACYRCGGPHLARDCRQAFAPNPLPGRSGDLPAVIRPSGFFDDFAAHVGLGRGQLNEWEQDLRQKLLDVLHYLPDPGLPLVEWINCRIGAEVETYLDASGNISVRLRSAPRGVRNSGPPPARGAPERPPPDRGPPPREALPKDEKRRDAFFEKLPAGEFNKSETKLRNAIFEFLATWTSSDKATLVDISNDDIIETLRSQFVPKVVTLQEWIERRMGEEVFFRRDRQGNDIVDVTPIGQEAVEDMIQELERKRAAGEDTNPKGGKRPRV